MNRWSQNVFLAILLVLTLGSSLAQAQLILKNKSTKTTTPLPELQDYRGLYPKSTPAEYKRAADKSKISCVRHRTTVLKINPKEAGPGETPEKTCDCYFRNIAMANDIHEVQVIDAYFRGVELPPSVFADDPDIGDVFDERPDYITHANNLIQSCKVNAAHVEPFSTPESKNAPTPVKKKAPPVKTEKADGSS
ncbi:MAG: hypothetical protein ACK5P7_07385 [Bdellovibrio sp.]